MFVYLLLITAPAFAKTKEEKQAEVRKNAHDQALPGSTPLTATIKTARAMPPSAISE
jgi:hypothetical protein